MINLKKLYEEYMSNLKQDMEEKRETRSKGVRVEYAGLSHSFKGKRIRTIKFEVKDPNGSGKKHKVRIQIPELREIIKLKKSQNLVEAIETSLKAGNINVHCSCLTGDTLIPTLDGNVKRIDEMGEGEEFWIYSSDENGSMIPKKAKSLGVTGTSDRLIRIVLDNDMDIKCTPNHLIRLRDGSYKEAKDIRPNDSLMPLYRNINEKGYEEFKDNKSGKWVKTHTRVARNEESLSNEFYDKLKWLDENRDKNNRLVTHHKDENKRNNLPSNLQWMGDYEHWMYHAKLGTDRLRKTWDYWKDDDFYNANVERMRENGRKNNIKTNSNIRIAVNNGYNNWLDDGGREFYSNHFSNISDEHRNYLKNRGKDIMDSLWSNEDWKKYKSKKQSEFMKEYHNNNPENVENFTNMVKSKDFQTNAQKSKIFKVFGDIEFDKKEINLENYNIYKKKRRAVKIEKYYNSIDDAKLEYSTWNHKVKDIEIIELDEPINVYDLNVPDTHNFLLESGVYVHNCEDFKYKGYEWMADSGDYGIKKQSIAPEIMNPELEGSVCKHVGGTFDQINKFLPDVLVDLRTYLLKRRKTNKR